ncbi:MAG: energy transducer TonB family protein [Burkholderiaceae bacterium]
MSQALNQPTDLLKHQAMGRALADRGMPVAQAHPGIAKAQAHPELPKAQALWVALGLSALLHLGFFFAPWAVLMQPSRPKLPSSLELVFVNAQNDLPPLAPEVLAQAPMSGGGDDRAGGRYRSPYLANRLDKDSAHHQAVMDEALKAEQVQSHAERLAKKQQVPEKPGLDLEQARELARLQAQIDQRMGHLSNMPRRLVYGVNAKAVSWAAWADRWVAKIERVGTQRLVALARQARFDRVLVRVDVDRSGRVIKLEIHQASRYPELNQAVQEIVRAASPFAPFDAAMRAEGDVISMVRWWHFTREGLRTDS